MSDIYIFGGSRSFFRLLATADILKAELHCHNIYSNYRNNSDRIPFDCGVSIQEQFERAFVQELDVLFITNHNTLDGYRQMLEYQENHEKYRTINVYPAQEITLNNLGHVLAYGITEEIRSGMSLEETLDAIRSQSAISCAAHPFAVSNGIRNKASMCDLMESFNSNNIDIFSNIVAEKFSKDNQMKTISGSDSHVSSTLGRCVNTIESDNDIDSILTGMRKGRFKIDLAQYATKAELYEHARYVLASSRESLLDYSLTHYPRAHKAVRWALNSFLSARHDRFWRSIASFSLYLTKRASMKVNMKGHDPKVFENRSWKRLISMSLVP
ncbi:MAG TPA: PHP-associated domain-containing protein [Nitrososphaeraceae archaeon]